MQMLQSIPLSHQNLKHLSPFTGHLNTPELFDTVMHKRRAWCKADSARPETIAWMNDRGFKIKAAKKGANSIGDGILRLKRYRNIIVHSVRCPQTTREFDKYSWKVNKQTEKIIKIPEDANNHHIDAIRYATEGKEAPKGRTTSGKKKASKLNSNNW